MTNGVSPNTAAAVSRDGLKAAYGSAEAVPARRNIVMPARRSENAAEHLPDSGPAYRVEVSEKGREVFEARKEPKSVAVNKADNQKDVLNDVQNAPKDQVKTKQQMDQEQRIARELARLERVQRSVETHEMAHMTAGGAAAGGVTYSYSRGPDGKMYISGGEVPISAKEGRTPEETIRNMQAVQRAALAPSDPSPQDLSTAAAAALIEQRARRIAWQQKAEAALPPDKAEPPSLFRKPAAMPTSLEGLINMLFPGAVLSTRSGQAPGAGLTSV